MKITDKEGGGAIVKWTFFYEKQHEGVEDPKGYLDMLTTAGKDVDAYLINAKKGEMKVESTSKISEAMRTRLS